MINFVSEGGAHIHVNEKDRQGYLVRKQEIVFLCFLLEQDWQWRSPQINCNNNNNNNNNNDYNSNDDQEDDGHKGLNMNMCPFVFLSCSKRGITF